MKQFQELIKLDVQLKKSKPCLMEKVTSSRGKHLLRGTKATLSHQARSYVLLCLKELGIDNLSIQKTVQRSRYGYSVYLEGRCPIHKRIHHSNNFKIQQPYNAHLNASIFCFHDNSLIKLNTPITALQV